MKNIKFITMVSACAAIIMTSSPAKALITLDPGNIAGTIGIVINGATGIMQSVEIITNGSLLNSVIGDAAGTLRKFADTFGGNVQKALQMAQEAQARIQEGQAAYNKYKSEIESRKAKYQALLDQLNVNKESYSDNAEEEDGGYPADYDSQEDADYDPDTTSTIEASKNSQNSSDNLSENTNSVQSSDTSLPSVVDSGQPSSPALPSVIEAKPSSEVALPSVINAKPAVINNTSSTGRRPFSFSNEIPVEPVIEEQPTPADKAAAAAVDAVSSETVSETLSPDTLKNEIKPRFRVSPLKLEEPAKLDKVSVNEVSFISHQLFADEISDVKGVNYDSKGTFVTPFAKRCGLSVKDLVEYESMKSCLTKIVAENNAKDQEDAINSQKDCETMVFETVVALLSEATKDKYEASNYTDTLDKQDELGAESSTTRDDTGVIGLSQEETQKLLNQMNMHESGAILLSGVQKICAMSKNVLVDSEKSESSDGGK